MPKQSRLSDFLWQTHEGKDDYLRRLKTAVVQTAVRVRLEGNHKGERAVWGRNAAYDPDRFTNLMAPVVLVGNPELAEKVLAGDDYEDEELLAAVAAAVEIFA